MTMKVNKEPAKIFEFPAGGRASFVGPRSRAKGTAHQTPSQIVRAQIVRAEFGRGWYHEAAIQETEPARKR
jgi:uncharacterized protein DUF2735